MSWSEIKKAINTDISVPLNTLITSAKNTLNTAITNSISSNKTNVLNATSIKPSKYYIVDAYFTPSSTRSDILRVTGTGVLYRFGSYINSTKNQKCSVTITIDGTDLFSDITIAGSSDYGNTSLNLYTTIGPTSTYTYGIYYYYFAPILFEKSLVITGINSTSSSNGQLCYSCYYRLL